MNREIEQVSLARFRLACDASPAARKETSQLLETLARDALSGKRIGPRIEIPVLKARVALARSSEDEAMRAIDEALCYAQPAGFFRVFIEEGPEIADLLRRGLKAGSWSDPPLRAFVQRLIAAS